MDVFDSILPGIGEVFDPAHLLARAVMTLVITFPVPVSVSISIPTTISIAISVPVSIAVPMPVPIAVAASVPVSTLVRSMPVLIG
jgi:hypothetical protein